MQEESGYFSGSFCYFYSMIIPPIKIQGKKTKIVPKIMEIAQTLLSEHKTDTWAEPFLGSGVVAFNCPSSIKKVYANDINPHIINFYKSVQDKTITPERIRDEFSVHSKRLLQGGGDYYKEIKDRFNTSFETMDFLFLTRTGFNGVMRFNNSGKWNVPFCKLNDRLSAKVTDDLAVSVRELGDLFQKKEYVFSNQPFEEVMASVPENTLFYCDPPYYGLQTQYFKGWEKEDEIRLNELLKGKLFIYSTWLNDGHRDNPMIQDYWKDYEIEGKQHKYNVAEKSTQRSQVTEGLIYTKTETQFKLW